MAVRAGMGRAGIVKEKIKKSEIGGYARSALLRAGLRRKEGSLFCVFTARLKPCPDTCMAGGCGVAVQADVGCGRIVTQNQRTVSGGFCALRVAAREPVAKEEVLFCV
ncbi:MAG: hypothetical protein LAO76_09020 [Acidobacteriia bacterium]|nr:hypothetical protein [Terriglobia bacterium]